MSDWTDRYDAWKLASPYDNEVEVFESKHRKLFTCFEDDINEFDELIDEAIKDPNIYLKDDTMDLESLEDYIEMLYDHDDFFKKLHNDSYDAEQAFHDHNNGERENALEAKGEAMMQARKDGE